MLAPTAFMLAPHSNAYVHVYEPSKIIRQHHHLTVYTLSTSKRHAWLLNGHGQVTHSKCSRYAPALPGPTAPPGGQWPSRTPPLTD